MELTKAFTLSVPDEEAIRIRDDVNFFQTVRAAFLKKAPSEKRTEEDLESAIRQIVSRAVASEGVVNIFAEAGLRNPDISVLSDDFLAEVRGMPHRNLAVELLQKLIRGELSTRTGLLRRAGDQRQRGEGAGRRDSPDHRAGARGDCQEERHHRLDGERERKGRDEERGPASTEEARVPAGQGEEGDRHSDRAGGVAVRGMDKHLKSRV